MDPSEAAALIAPIPLLIVHGRQDTYFPVEHAQSIEAGARRGAAERGVQDNTVIWLLDDFAHAESATSAELADRIGVWAMKSAGITGDDPSPEQNPSERG
jgi:fermentation-respiration switch protein FrsA (DUF1100 family)